MINMSPSPVQPLPAIAKKKDLFARDDDAAQQVVAR
jgi:hypothetical protein